jgi:hypothetical protein
MYHNGFYSPAVSACLRLKIYSNVNLSGVVFPKDEIQVSLLGQCIPTRGSFVIVSVFGVCRVVRYIKTSRTVKVSFTHLNVVTTMLRT